MAKWLRSFVDGYVSGTARLDVCVVRRWIHLAGEAATRCEYDRDAALDARLAQKQARYRDCKQTFDLEVYVASRLGLGCRLASLKEHWQGKRTCVGRMSPDVMGIAAGRHDADDEGCIPGMKVSA